MSRVCEVCERGPRTKISRSHSHVATKKRQFLNLQTKKIDGKKVKICTKCLKTLAKKNK